MAGWQVLSRPSAAEGGGRRPLAIQPYSATEVDGWQHKLSRVSQNRAAVQPAEKRPMKKLLSVTVIIVGVLLMAGGVMVANDLSKLRSDVADINANLGNLENALRGEPSFGTRDLVRRRVDQIRDDLRKLSLRHQWAMTFFGNETDAAWDRFRQVEQQSRR
jgi:hypothetical protein